MIDYGSIIDEPRPRQIWIQAIKAVTPPWGVPTHFWVKTYLTISAVYQQIIINFWILFRVDLALIYDLI